MQVSTPGGTLVRAASTERCVFTTATGTGVFPQWSGTVLLANSPGSYSLQLMGTTLNGGVAGAFNFISVAVFG